MCMHGGEWGHMWVCTCRKPIIYFSLKSGGQYPFCLQNGLLTPWFGQKGIIELSCTCTRDMCTRQGSWILHTHTHMHTQASLRTWTSSITWSLTKRSLVGIMGCAEFRTSSCLWEHVCMCVQNSGSCRWVIVMMLRCWQQDVRCVAPRILLSASQHHHNHSLKSPKHVHGDPAQAQNHHAHVLGLSGLPIHDARTRQQGCQAEGLKPLLSGSGIMNRLRKIQDFADDRQAQALTCHQQNPRISWACRSFWGLGLRTWPEVRSSSPNPKMSHRCDKVWGCWHWA